MSQRRREDRIVDLALRGAPALVEELRGDGVFDYSFEVVGVARELALETESGSELSSGKDVAHPVLLRAGGAGQEVVVAGAAVPLPSADDRHREQLERAAAMWRQYWLRLWKRNQLPEKLIAFFQDLSAADAPARIGSVIARHAVQAVGGFEAVVLLADAERPGSALAELSVSEHSRLAQPGLIAAADLEEALGPLYALVKQLWSGGGLAMVAHVPIGDQGMLLLMERRSDRIFDVDDWEVLGTLAEQGRQALLRVQLLRGAQALSLTDPLTGLANRRHMEVVLKHAWSAAQRGEGLAVMMLDLDGFKAVNDTYGHAAGDQVLCIAADCLRREARGSDAVVRFGGDEFLVVMPRGTAEGARALAERVRKRLSGWVGITEGIATHHATHQTVDDLIRAADADLYRRRGTRLTLAESAEAAD